MARIRAFLLGAVFLSVLAPQALGYETFQDGFYSSELDSARWTTAGKLYMGEVKPTFGGLSFTLKPGAPGTPFGIYAQFACVVTGDFDAQVDYEILNWPPKNGLFVGLGAGPLGSVYRLQGGGSGLPQDKEFYQARAGKAVQSIETMERTGKLRIERRGVKVTAYGGSKPIASADVNANPIAGKALYIGMWGANQTSGGAAKFTNFSLSADGIVCPALTVDIDVKPGSDINPVNVGAKGVIPVAVLSAKGFDASTVEAASVRFGPLGASPTGAGGLEDIDMDGDLDLVLHFDSQKTGITCQSTKVSLSGKTFKGQYIKGQDAVSPRGCK